MAKDLLVLSARLFARPAVAALGVEGRTPEKRRDQLVREVTSYDTEEELVDRHIARAAVWGVMFAVTAPLLIAIAVLFALVFGGIGGVGGELAWGVLLFQFWMGCIHGLKALIAAMLVRHRWNPNSRLARVFMVSEAVDVVVALIIVAVVRAFQS